MADSYSQKKRKKMNYRYAYLKRNPGLFGCIWSCAYCHRLILGKENLEVDHVMPLNNVLGRNASYNLVAACHRCNRRKSDIVDGRVVIGYASKLNEEIIAMLPGILKAPYALLSWIVLYVVSLFGRIIGFLFGKSSAVTKVVVVAAIFIALIYVKSLV